MHTISYTGCAYARRRGEQLYLYVIFYIGCMRSSCTRSSKGRAALRCAATRIRIHCRWRRRTGRISPSRSRRSGAPARLRAHATHTCHAASNAHLSRRVQRTPVTPRATHTCHAACNAHLSRRVRPLWRDRSAAPALYARRCVCLIHGHGSKDGLKPGDPEPALLSLCAPRRPSQKI